MAIIKFFSRFLRLIRIQRSRLLKNIIFVSLLLVTLYLLMEHDKFTDIANLSNIQPRYSQLLDTEQVRRKQHIAQVCLKEMKTSPYLRTPAGRFLFYSPMRFSYCVVAKAGCSFWISIVRILLNDFSYNNIKKYPMDITKLEAHGPRSKMRHLTYTNGQDYLRNSTLFFFARNPYSRLFSGFTDKIFLPELWNSLNKYIASLTREEDSSGDKECVSDITFTEFLRYVVHSEKTGEQRNGHWVPVYRTCNPCTWNFTFVGKQETFVKDSRSILKHFGLSRLMKNYSQIQNMEHQTKSQIEYTFYANFPSITSCKSSYINFAKRLWHTFQLQGYIHRSSSLPKILFGSNAKENVKLFQDAVVTEIRKNTMSHDESARQKKSMMLKAYSRVPHSVIKDIQQVYALDFKLFSYDIESYRH